MPTQPALDVLRAAGRMLAHGDALEPSLVAMLQATADALGIVSAAVLVTAGDSGGLEIAASIGVGDPAGLAAAVRHPGHPISRTAADRATSFDATPMAPGGPALRSHLPLLVTRDGHRHLVGVLATAHDRPTTAEERSILEAAADLIAVAIERAHTPT